MQLELSNIFTISVSESGAGVGSFNTSNIAIFSHEPYDSGSFGSNGYKIYLSPTEVGTDFGTDSDTYAMALSIFSQSPNILAGGGYLVVIPFVVEVQHLAFSGTAASGTFILNFDGDATAAINWNDTVSQIQTKVRTLLGLEEAVVTGSIATSLNISMKGYYGDAPLMTVTSNSLATSAPASITVTVTSTTTGETLAVAIARTKDLVQYFGILGTKIFSQVDMLAAGVVVQALIKMAFFGSRTEADIDPGGMLDLLATGGYDHSRGLYYGASTDLEVLQMMSAYAGRGLSVDFAGSNTTITMNLKDLKTIQPDPSMTQTIYAKCKEAGADVYVSFQGVAKVGSFGANKFFDQVYNLLAFVGDLQVTEFNILAQTSTKIPQTEGGMSILKGGARQVCEQYVGNQYIAPGSWTAPEFFGNQQDLIDNIAQRGYYIYSAPISQQLQAAREAREAPLIQIAIKEAGAIHTGNILITVNR